MTGLDVGDVASIGAVERDWPVVDNKTLLHLWFYVFVMAASAVDEATTRNLTGGRGRRGWRHDGNLNNIALRRNEPFAGRTPGSVKVHESKRADS